MAEGSKALRLQIGVDETIEIAVHDGADIAVFVTGAVILYERVGHKHIGTDLAAPGNLLLIALDVLNFLEVLALLDFQQLRLQRRGSGTGCAPPGRTR